MPRKGLFFMKNFNTTRLIIAIIFIIAAVVFFLVKTVFKKKPITTKFITRTAIFASISILLYIVPGLKFALPIFPSFLEIHLDEVPLLMAGFAYGPLSGMFGLLLKTLVKLPMTNTLGVGELADFIYSAFFIIPSALIYKKHRTFKGVVVALSVGTICQIIAASFITTFVILDFYMAVMNLPEAVIMGMIKAAGINISSLSWPFLYTVGIPFNALKDAMVIAITLLLYKRIHKLVEKITD